jgi:hypothetical protein
MTPRLPDASSFVFCAGEIVECTSFYKTFTAIQDRAAAPQAGEYIDELESRCEAPCVLRHCWQVGGWAGGRDFDISVLYASLVCMWNRRTGEST